MAGSQAVVLGNFDGVHLGHISLLEKARELVGDGKVTVRTFDRIRGEAITPGGLRFDLLKKYGADEIITDSFEDIKDLSPDEFVRDFLMGGYSHAVCGFNYRFGKNRGGDTDTLRELFGNVTVMPEKTLCGITVSSTEIRARLKSGDMAGAVEMLSHPFIIKSGVTRGKQLGRTIGFPTVNQSLDGVIPMAGAYYGFVGIGGAEYPTVTGITECPTTGNEPPHAETHIIGFDGDLYGKVLSVSILGMIRKEKKFASVEELQNQLEKDVVTAMENFRRA